MASESFINALLLFLGLFLKIFLWVPLCWDVPSTIHNPSWPYTCSKIDIKVVHFYQKVSKTALH